jgi:hypothetical protein
MPRCTVHRPTARVAVAAPTICATKPPSVWRASHWPFGVDEHPATSCSRTHWARRIHVQTCSCVALVGLQLQGQDGVQLIAADKSPRRGAASSDNPCDDHTRLHGGKSREFFKRRDAAMRGGSTLLYARNVARRASARVRPAQRRPDTRREQPSAIAAHLRDWRSSPDEPSRAVREHRSPGSKRGGVQRAADSEASECRSARTARTK